MGDRRDQFLRFFRKQRARLLSKSSRRWKIAIERLSDRAHAYRKSERMTIVRFFGERMLPMYRSRPPLDFWQLLKDVIGTIEDAHSRIAHKVTEQIDFVVSRGPSCADALDGWCDVGNALMFSPDKAGTGESIILEWLRSAFSRCDAPALTRICERMPLYAAGVVRERPEHLLKCIGPIFNSFEISPAASSNKPAGPPIAYETARTLLADASRTSDFVPEALLTLLEKPEVNPGRTYGNVARVLGCVVAQNLRFAQRAQVALFTFLRSHPGHAGAIDSLREIVVALRNSDTDKNEKVWRTISGKVERRLVRSRDETERRLLRRIPKPDE